VAAAAGPALMAGSGLPLPPLELANRVGSLEGAPDPYAYYEELGRRTRADIEAVLPAEWSYAGKHVLDFGCGAGRTLRHFAPVAEEAEIWGCDIDADSVAWLRERLSPPFHVFRNAEVPPLDRPDGFFDLIWCVSVFTHLTDTWSAWLLELRRVLAAGGLLVVTYMGEGMSEDVAGEPWDEGVIGMNVRKLGQSWSLGGPMVLHSPWWIREHWGRAFDVLELKPYGFATDPPAGQGTVVLRRTGAAVTEAELERLEPGDPRETAALVHNARTLAREIADLRRELEQVAGERDHLRSVNHAVTGSLSWRATAPLRGAKQAALRARARRAGG
jgi:SAM-dependent methyltransferase